MSATVSPLQIDMSQYKPARWNQPATHPEHNKDYIVILDGVPTSVWCSSGLYGTMGTWIEYETHKSHDVKDGDMYIPTRDALESEDEHAYRT